MIWGRPCGLCGERWCPDLETCLSRWERDGALPDAPGLTSEARPSIDLLAAFRLRQRWALCRLTERELRLGPATNGGEEQRPSSRR